MFRNRSFKVKFTKDPVVVDSKTEVVIISPKMKTIAIAAGALYTVKTVADTSSKIALHIATK